MTLDSRTTPEWAPTAQDRARMVAWLSADAAGLADMAAALRAAGWTVAEPGAPEVLLDQDGDCLSPVRYVRAEEPSR